ncbi:MAG TPA: hypothetical protein PLP44_08860 [Methylophilus sp.]|nr:hypothetical protein [Methylophilus sp.]
MLKSLITFLIGLILTSNAFAQPPEGKIALHISRFHYEHPVRLLHPYLDFWHMKGPMAEKISRESLKKNFNMLDDCNGDANVLLLLEPHMFYNPQMRNFHAELIVRVYANQGPNPVITIKKQAQQEGDLALTPEVHMEKAYLKAIQKIIKELETDKTFLASLKGLPIRDLQSFCNGMYNWPLAKFYY